MHSSREYWMFKKKDKTGRVCVTGHGCWLYRKTQSNYQPPQPHQRVATSRQPTNGVNDAVRRPCSIIGHYCHRPSTAAVLSCRRRRTHDTTSPGSNLLLLQQSSSWLLMLVNWINQMSFALRTSRTLVRAALSAPTLTYCSAQKYLDENLFMFLSVANESNCTLCKCLHWWWL